MAIEAGTDTVVVAVAIDTAVVAVGTGMAIVAVETDTAIAVATDMEAVVVIDMEAVVVIEMGAVAVVVVVIDMVAGIEVVVDMVACALTQGEAAVVEDTKGAAVMTAMVGVRLEDSAVNLEEGVMDQVALEEEQSILRASTALRKIVSTALSTSKSVHADMVIAVPGCTTNRYSVKLYWCSICIRIPFHS